MQLNAYRHFNGQCEDAFKFYQKCLNGQMKTMLSYGDSPGDSDVAADWRGKIMHACLVVGNTTLMASDGPASRYAKPQGFSVNIATNDPAEAERVFQAMSENGQVIMPLQETFRALRFGMFTDRFGIGWMVNCEKAA